MKVDFSKTKNKEQAYAAVKEAITPELIEKFKVKAKLDYTDDKITASGKGFKLNMIFNDSCCEVKTDLSLIMRPLKGKILEQIEKQLKRVI